MNTSDLQSREKIVNGGPVYLVEPGEWEEIVRTGDFLGEKVEAVAHMKAVLENWIKLALEYPEISTAFSRMGGGRFAFMPVLLLEIWGELQRVHIERLTCEACRWSGSTAYPMMPDLYFGIPDNFGEMRKAGKFPVLPCPACGAKLPRHPIWIGPVHNAGGLTSPYLGDIDNQLFYSVKLNDAGAFRTAIDGGANVNTKDEYNETPLIYAAQTGSPEMVEELLKLGAKIDHKGENRWTPLRYSIDKRRTATARLLIEHGADIHGTDSKRETHVYWAVFRRMDEIVRLLIERGADVDAAGRGGSSCLSTAVMYPDNLEMVRLLIASGADLTFDAQNVLWSAIYTAANTGETGVLDFLFNAGLEVSPVFSDGTGVVDHLERFPPSAEGTKSVVEYLRNKGF